VTVDAAAIPQLAANVIKVSSTAMLAPSLSDSLLLLLLLLLLLVLLPYTLCAVQGCQTSSRNRVYSAGDVAARALCGRVTQAADE
jgi:hypothetical protein